MQIGRESITSGSVDTDGRVWLHARMRTLLNVIIFLTIAAPAFADDKTCVLAAAERLPRIAGLQIKETRTRPIPDEMRAKWTAGGELPVLVDVDYAAAGVSDTATYLCAIAAGRPMVTKIIP